jgi:hypothetical protein
MKKLFLISSLVLTASSVNAAQVFTTDVIVQGSECVGFDCATSESFGSDTLRLKENNLRIHFDDTSSSASFPKNDWRITINDSTNGGSEYFAIQDATAGTTPFKIDAGAGANALIVESGGNVGIGTSNPAVQLQVTDGNSPALRLEQNGSSGFTPQIWDIAGNETNFFVRDVTNSSKLPFRIKPSAPDDSLFIAADGDIGLGTDNPSWNLHLTDTSTVIGQFESSDDGAVQIRMKTDSTNRRFVAVDGSDVVKSQLLFEDATIKLAGQSDSSNLYATFDTTGLYVNGSISTPGGTLNVPDYVFESDYKLMPLDDLKSFLKQNKHLPEVPSAKDVAKNGLNYTDMQLTLLKKVEELTLYTLAQHEKNLAQQKTINDLMAKVEKLSSKK